MNISDESTKLMRFFSKNFDKEITNKSSTSQKKTDSILSTLYEKLRLSDKEVDSLNSSNKVKKYIKNDKLPNSDLLHSSFVVDECREFMDKKTKYIQINTKIFDKKITIYYTLFEKKINIKKYEKSIKNILILLHFLLLHSKEHKTGSLVIYLYLTPIKKTLPKTSISILDQNSVNTAVTTSCNKNGSILLYRKEEWFKVLIHELFHLLCLDFSGLEYNKLKKSISNIFQIKSEYNIAETYSEWWATIINCLFSSYNILDDVCDKNAFLLYGEFFIEFERIFSLFQVIKILDFMGLDYKELISKNNEDIQLRHTLYREKTNVFCYYILKTILLYNYDDFLIFCLQNNSSLLKFKKTPQNFDLLYDFIKKKYNNVHLIKSLTKNHIFSLFYKLKMGARFPYKDVIINSTRMTIVEITTL
jgi:hypothetical protein